MLAAGQTVGKGTTGCRPNALDGDDEEECDAGAGKRDPAGV
jgi:hypothetical protein